MSPSKPSLATPPTLLVTGKGGVGKTTVAAALGLRLADAGRRTLLLEYDPRESLHDTLGVEPSDGSIVSVSERLDLCHVRPQAVVEEWIVERAVGGAWLRRLLDSDVFRQVVAGAPGVRELAVLRRAVDAAEDGYDAVVLDAPAGGHGLSWIDAPVRLAAALPDGPVVHEVHRVEQAILDPERFGVWLVSEPTAMSTAESLEFAEAMHASLGRGPDLWVLNGRPPVPPAATSGDVDPRFDAWRREREAEIVRRAARLRERAGDRWLEIPTRNEPFGAARSRAIADGLPEPEVAT